MGEGEANDIDGDWQYTPGLTYKGKTRGHQSHTIAPPLEEKKAWLYLPR